MIKNSSPECKRSMWISRDWRHGLTEAAEIGHDADNHPFPWIVRETRTADGRPMERTDVDMIELSVRHFATDREASAWCRENGYR